MKDMDMDSAIRKNMEEDLVNLEPIDTRTLEEKIGLYFTEFTEVLGKLKERLCKCIEELFAIAEDLDKFHKNTTIASVAGSAVGIAGGITTIVGLVLAPFTLGASLIVSGVGIGVATAGGVTGVAASLADSINIKKKCSRVEEIMKEVNSIIEKLQEHSKIIDELIQNIKKQFNINDLNDIAKLTGRAGLVTTEIVRVVPLARISAVAARGAEVAAQGARAIMVASGVLAAVFLIVDTFYAVRGARDLQRGCLTKEAEEIRRVVMELFEILSELRRNEEELSDIMRLSPWRQ
ncbi:apolipoprotein L3-like [Gastrophryne carolinensis]